LNPSSAREAGLPEAERQRNKVKRQNSLPPHHQPAKNTLPSGRELKTDLLPDRLIAKKG
jgi:hypothetical protein